jgi:NitT/TauT family transport system permease protein
MHRLSPVVTLVSLAGFVAVWAVAAALAADPLLLPSPLRVAEVVGREAASGALATHIGATLARVALAFTISLFVGTVVGLALARAPAVDRWADPWVLLLLNIPALVVIVLCYLWVGLNEVALVLAVSINKFAMVVVTMREGGRALSRPLAELSTVYRVSAATRLRHVVLPQLAPFLSAAARNGLAIIWKIVLVAEFLGRGSGVGFQIHLYFQLFDVAHVLAYALSFVAVMLLIEAVFLKPVEVRATAWRAT